jgi:putative acetyltransferase
MQVRPERPADRDAVARVTDAAFGQPDESHIIEAVRRAGCPAVSLVAVDGTEVVGHILFTPVDLDPPAAGVVVMGLGPMAVAPARQRQGVGSALVREGLRACAGSGCSAVVVLGHPRFYPRFGFQPASGFGLKSEYSVPDDVFMAIELVPGSLEGSGGLVRYRPEFAGG